MSGDDTLLPAAVPGSGPRQSMSLPHNVNPHQMAAEQSGNRWKRFQPLKKLQRMFRRKSKTKEDDSYPEAHKSFSASQLLPGQQRRTSPQRDSPPLQSRLSMSHDSIFQSEAAQQGERGSAMSIPSIPGVSSQLTAELRGVLLKRRGDDSDDDPGLPHSPATPPNAARIQKDLKGQSGKSGGSCSDGSLLSMYSSGTCTDDDIFGPLSKHPSKASLGRDQDGLELETAGALSHSAAKHRISVRPRRNHGAPRQHRARARPQTVPAGAGLPPTVEEESPPATPTAAAAAVPAAAKVASSASPRLTTADRARRTPSASPSRTQSIRAGSPDGAAVPRPSPVKRSKSSVADRRIRDVSPRKLWSRDPPEPEERRGEKPETFFSRIFGSRRSGRKKKDGRSLSPEVEEPAAARPPAGPRAAGSRHRAPHAPDTRSPPSAHHADIIRPPPADIIRPPPADMIRPPPADILRSPPSDWHAEPPRAADPVRPQSEVPRPPPEALLRRGPPFLADVRAEVRALASGADRGDDSMTVSPQVLRRHRASAAAGRTGAESPRVRPKLVGLTAYQQRVAHMQGGGTPSPESDTKRRSFSCENISEEGSRRNSCSGMALGSVLGLIKSTTAAERPERIEVEVRAEQETTRGSSARGAGHRDASLSPGAGPKSLDSGLLSAAAEPAPPPKACSAESVPGGAPERASRRSPDRSPAAESAGRLPEFLTVQLQHVDSRPGGAEPAPAPTAAPAPAEPRPEPRRQAPPLAEKRESPRRDSGEAAEPAREARPVPAPRSGSPEPLRRPSQARGRPDADVVLRSRPPAGEDSELLKVFKRRSLKSRDSESEWAPPTGADEKENEKPREETEETVVSASIPAASAVSSLVSKHVSVVSSHAASHAPSHATNHAASHSTSHAASHAPAACEPEPEGSPPRLRRPELARRQTSVQEARAAPPEPAAPRPASEQPAEPRRASEQPAEPRRVSVVRRDSEARRPSQPGDSPAGWLKQTVRERREQREQREQQQLRSVTQKELALESEPLGASRAAASSRSSRVLEMANSFQKLQTT